MWVLLLSWTRRGSNDWMWQYKLAVEFSDFTWSVCSGTPQWWHLGPDKSVLIIEVSTFQNFNVGNERCSLWYNFIYLRLSCVSRDMAAVRGRIVRVGKGTSQLCCCRRRWRTCPSNLHLVFHFVRTRAWQKFSVTLVTWIPCVYRLYRSRLSIEHLKAAMEEIEKR